MANGIWMCRDHGKAIDSTDSEFTVETLLLWKKQAEDESRRRVLEGEVVRQGPEVKLSDLAERLKVAALADPKVFRRTAKWPSTSIALTLKVEGFEEFVTTS